MDVKELNNRILGLEKKYSTKQDQVSNYYKEEHSKIISAFQQQLIDSGIENAIIQINEWCDGSISEISDIQGSFDCMTSRTLTRNGIFSCPFLANDYRGRMGSDFTDFSKSVRLETPYCSSCIKNKEKMFSVDIDW